MILTEEDIIPINREKRTEIEDIIMRFALVCDSLAENEETREEWKLLRRSMPIIRDVVEESYKNINIRDCGINIEIDKK